VRFVAGEANSVAPAQEETKGERGSEEKERVALDPGAPIKDAGGFAFHRMNRPNQLLPGMRQFRFGTAQFERDLPGFVSEHGADSLGIRRVGVGHSPRF